MPRIAPHFFPPRSLAVKRAPAWQSGAPRTPSANTINPMKSESYAWQAPLREGRPRNCAAVFADRGPCGSRMAPPPNSRSLGENCSRKPPSQPPPQFLPKRVLLAAPRPPVTRPLRFQSQFCA